MKLPFALQLIALLLFALVLNTSKVTAQVATPDKSNIAACIQIPLSTGNGTILLVPNLISKTSHVSWALLQPGNSNISNLNWNDVDFNLADSTYPAIVGLVNKPGTSQFYIVYKDGTIAVSSATASGVSAPAILGRDTNYTQFTYSALAGQNTLYLLTADGNIDVSRNGGQSWKVDSNGAPFNYFTAVAVDTFKNVYAFYTPGGTVALYKQEAGSNTWAKINFPTGQLPTNLFIDRHNRFFISTYGNGVYCSKDTGNSWTQSNTTINGALGGQMNDDAFGNIYLLGSGGTHLYRSTDTGATWTPIDAPITQQEEDANYPNVINSVSGDTVLTASTIYGVFVSTDQGNTWTAANSGLHETQFNGFYKSAAGRLVETTNNGLFYADPQSTVFTHPLPADGYGYAGPVLADTLGNIYTSTQNGFAPGPTNFYWQSSNSGTSWQADTEGISAVSSPGTFGVDEYGTQYLSGKGNFGVQLMYKKTAGSNSFALDTAGLFGMNDFFYNLNNIASDDYGRLFIAGGGDANALTCWSRPINGSTWTIDTAGLPFRTSISYLTHESNHNMVAITLSGLSFHQSGVWHNIPLPPVASGYIAVSAVAADNSGGILASFTYTSPSFLTTFGYGVYCTHDHGTTWTKVGLTDVNVYGLYNFGDTTYALSDLGIFALTCSGVVGPLSIAEPRSDVKNNMVVYPNPTSGLCHVAFTATTTEKSELALIDLSGRNIKTISIGNEMSEVSFTTSDMTCGVYICVLTSDGITLDVKKLIIIK